jgi:hypothetical protein
MSHTYIPGMLAHEVLPHIISPLVKLYGGRRFWMVISYVLNMVSFDCVEEH